MNRSENPLNHHPEVSNYQQNYFGPKGDLEKTLAEHLKITDADITERKELLRLTKNVEEELLSFKPVAFDIVDEVVEEFYSHQVVVPKIRHIIGDIDTLSRLKSAMRKYIVTLFNGEYGSEYVNSRLRIGKVHARIGVEPKLYVSSMHQLEELLSSRIQSYLGLEERPASVAKIFLFDLQFVFDTYIQGLVAEVAMANDEIVKYSNTLEEKIRERTEEIDRVAQTDELTGLWNRRNFFVQFRRELALAKRREASLALVFLDLDDFKKINDLEGHIVGDQVLANVAASITETIRGSDTAYRYGGDEFCVLLPDTDRNKAKQFCKRLEKSVYQNTNDTIKLSAGIAVAGPEKYPELEAMIEQADEAMYAIKSAKQKNVVEANFTQFNSDERTNE